MIYVQFRYRCPCYNYNYYHSIKRAGRFVGVAYIIILIIIVIIIGSIIGSIIIQIFYYVWEVYLQALVIDIASLAT